MNALVAMKDIEKSFPGVRALHNAQLELGAGEVHALMGENGAGKSTMMKILAGIYRRDGGEILLDGKPVEVNSPRQAQDLGIGIIHQELNLMPHLTAAQNMFIGREPRKAAGLLLDEAKLNADAAEIFASMHLKLDPRTLVGGLTIARQQMVEIAKALSYRSRVLIMDEPTAALNDAEINELFAIIARLKAEGVGIVYISHKMDELKRIADRVTVMRDGEYIGTVPAADTPVEKIISMMVGRALTEDRPEVPDHSNAEVVLEVRNLNRGTVIRDVSFSVRKGEILGFAGLMGAGRTEVARAIFGADRRDSGNIFVHGKKVDIRMPQDAVRAGIGYLSEDRKHFGLATGMDVRNNVVLASLSRFAGPGGLLRESAMHEAASRYIDQLAIKTPSDRQEVRLLSGGNQQKIVIAKWLLRDCEVLIFDEPTRGIDVGAKNEIYKLLNALAQQGRAIIVISSELPEILRLSHRIAVMCEGRLTGILSGGASQEEIMHLATLRGEAANHNKQDKPAKGEAK
ncbi:Galactose/methyl galactoside import ATP-binding protein MglA [Aminobacter sp. MSH1]|uniref:sugar ABC transporter ATP-binding protein n=1 Tax=Aminobacter sp. MSH1 TaxID=374606 RepID=UPI000D3B2FBF|nr:sugar ABC transporter ATP-binding protein [Aminobacter sp. MSH1]AWC21571.1 Galactose/methyl galactoside import ATP-binding protein MglA [Aminobacter sp. MSH1]